MSNNNILEAPTQEPEPSDAALVRQMPLCNNLEYLGHHFIRQIHKWDWDYMDGAVGGICTNLWRSQQA